ncbi:MAG: hypothetical protein WDZ75_01310 [Candidatus Paceibacterota bacterium]
MSSENDNNSEELNKPSPASGATKFSDSRQRAIWKELGALDPTFGPKIANIYEGIVLSLEGNNPEKISIVSHLARELTSILSIYKSSLPIQQKKIDEAQIRIELLKVIELIDSSTGSGADTELRDVIEGLLKKLPEQPTQRDQLQSVVNEHPILGARSPYFNEQFVKQWMRVNKFFVKNCHHHELRNKNDGSTNEDELERNWEVLESLIHRLLVEEPFYGVIAELDKLLNISDPSEQHADELMRHIVEPQHQRYFFDKCDNPKWLLLLKKRGAFSSPQDSVEKDGYIQFVPWPESGYLARIADRADEAVYGIIKDIDTENLSVLGNFVEAAIKSSPDVAEKYADLIVEKKWLRGRYTLRLPDQTSNLMEKLAMAGKVEKALVLADELFSVQGTGPVKVSDDPDSPLQYTHPDAKPFYDEWQFEQIIKNKTAELSQKKPVEVFGIYIRKLKEAIEIEQRQGDEENFYEYSHIWRPDITAARSHGREDVKNILLDEAVNLVQVHADNLEILKQFTSILKKQTYALFRRIEMHLYFISQQNFEAEIEAILSDERVIYAYNLRREYFPLLGKAFPSLSEKVQLEILSAIDKGPKFEKRDDFTDEEFVRVQDDWRNRYYGPIKDHLPEEYRAKYDALASKYGTPPEDSGEIISWDGGRSPLSKEELATMSAEDVAQYFVDYKTPDDPFERYSSNGLGMTFADVVKENPKKYVAAIDLFKENKLRPIYFYNFIRGLKESLQNGGEFDWEPVINLCHELIFQETLKSTQAHQDEQDWKTVRQTVADFLGDALGRGDNNPPISLQETVWDIISELVEDPEPTPEEEKRDGEGGLDPMTLAINTVRGEAMHAVINYGLWVARNLPDKTVDVKIPQHVIGVLDRHLDKKQDPSLAIHSIYGWRAPNISYLNKSWLEANKEKIFVKDSPEYLLAAWEGYLSNNVIKEVFQTLKPLYFEFVPFLGTFEKKGFRANDVDQRFPQHIMVSYVSDAENDDLVRFFFENAPAKARAEALNFAGRVVLRQQEGLRDGEQVLKRLTELWEQRISLPTESAEVEELQELGWWFKFSPVGKRETLELMTKTLELTKGKIDVPYEIVEELVKYVPEYPLESIKLLQLLAEAELESHEITYKRNEYREVFRLIKESDNKEAKQVKDRVINHLGSKGLIEEFRDLLE